MVRVRSKIKKIFRDERKPEPSRLGRGTLGFQRIREVGLIGKEERMKMLIKTNEK